MNGPDDPILTPEYVEQIRMRTTGMPVYYADAVLYAMRCGCFFPHRPPSGRRCTVPALIKWGAMGHLHNVVATACREREDTP